VIIGQGDFLALQNYFLDGFFVIVFLIGSCHLEIIELNQRLGHIFQGDFLPKTSRCLYHKVESHVSH